MRIDKKLNIIVPIERDDGLIYVHSTPIGREVFENYFVVISKTFSAIYAQGLGPIAGPRVAAMMLKKVAKDLGVWDGEAGVGNGLMAEIRRLSNVVTPGENGWTTLPLQNAIDRQILTEDELSEAEGAITFFMVASAMHRKRDLPAILSDGMGHLWGTQTTSLDSTEYARSLPTLTATESIGETAKPSSIPS